MVPPRRGDGATLVSGRECGDGAALVSGWERGDGGAFVSGRSGARGAAAGGAPGTRMTSPRLGDGIFAVAIRRGDAAADFCVQYFNPGCAPQHPAAVGGAAASGCAHRTGLFDRAACGAEWAPRSDATAARGDPPGMLGTGVFAYAA